MDLNPQPAMVAYVPSAILLGLTGMALTLKYKILN